MEEAIKIKKDTEDNISLNEEDIINQINNLNARLTKLKKNEKILKNLVLSGGSSKGLSYIGVIKALEEFNLIEGIEEIACSSIGSLFGVLIILGYTSTELTEIFMELDMNWLHNINSDSILNLINKYGLDNGENPEKFLALLLEFKISNKPAREITLLDLWNYNNVKIIISGSKIYKGIIDNELYSYETHPNLSVCKALRVSMAIPPIFTPLNEEDCHLVDGGITNNYLIDLYKNKLDYTLGILCSEKILREKCSNVIEVYKSIITFLINKETVYKNKRYKDNTILLEIDIPIYKIFTLSNQEKINIFNIGYYLTRQYLDIKDFKPNKLNNQNNQNKSNKINLNINVQDFIEKLKNTFLDKIKNNNTM